METVLLCFGLNDQQKALINYLCGGMHIGIRQISPAQYGQTIGMLASGRGAGLSAAPAVPFRGAMVVMCGFSQKQFHMLLDSMRVAGCFGDVLKAIGTPDNLHWSAARLYEELSKEHAAMQNGIRMHQS